MAEEADDLKSDCWCEEVARNITKYLNSGEYPPNLPPCEKVKRRNFRKRAKDFVVKQERLYYKNKKDGVLRLAISTKEEQQRVFMV